MALLRGLALLVALSLLIGIPTPILPAKSQSATGVVVPLYMRPGLAWQSLIQAKTAHPGVPLVAIVNPSSGPGSKKDFAFASGIQQLQASGIVVLGYVYTSYGARATNAVEGDIDSYHIWYGVNGIMFDEMPSQASYVSYYSTLVQYAKSAGLNFTMGNPGRDVPSSYLGIFDNIVIYENAGLPSLGFLGGWHASYPKAGFSFVAIGVSSLDTAFVLSASSYVGYLYVTDDSLPNPYDTVPIYFPDLMAALDPGNQSNTVTPPVEVPPTNGTITPPTNMTETPPTNVTDTTPTNGTLPPPTNSTETPLDNATVLPPVVSQDGNVSAVDTPGSVVTPGNLPPATTPSDGAQHSVASSHAGPDVWPVVGGGVVSAVLLLSIARLLDAPSAPPGIASTPASPSGRLRTRSSWLSRRSRPPRPADRPA
jgi:hypothetical protein